MRKFIFTAMIVLAAGCGGNTKPSPLVVESAVVNYGDSTLAAASVFENGAEIEDAKLFVNGTSLAYGLPVQFETESGLNVNLTVPMYYAQFPDAKIGDSFGMVAQDSTGELFYQEYNIKMPADAVITNPPIEAVLNLDDSVQMSWWNTPSADAFVADYNDESAFDGEEAEFYDNDVEYNDDEPGLVIDILGGGSTGDTISSEYLLTGLGEFSVDTLYGTPSWFWDFDPTESSFFLAANPNTVETTFEGAAPDVATEETLGAQQGLAIVKEYSKSQEGLRFTVRESNPAQITSPGTITVSFKMRRFKVSVAFIKAFDMNGNEYFSWVKKHIMKSKKKKYAVPLSVSPGTTVVIGTHDASFRGATYSY